MTIHPDSILIVDFGSQVTQLIARRVREAGVYSEIVPFSRALEGYERIRPNGVILSGGPASVTFADSPRAPRELFEAGVPMLGICYGHQLLAHAFGGVVGDNPAGREMGTAELELEPAARTDPLFAGLPARVRAHTTHLQTVLAPPPGATVLARSTRDTCQAFRLDDQVWGVQFHPEFSAGAMRAYIAGRAEALRREGEDPQRLHRAVRPAPLARRVLQRFVHHARRPC